MVLRRSALTVVVGMPWKIRDDYRIGPRGVVTVETLDEILPPVDVAQRTRNEPHRLIGVGRVTKAGHDPAGGVFSAGECVHTDCALSHAPSVSRDGSLTTGLIELHFARTANSLSGHPEKETR